MSDMRKAEYKREQARLNRLFVKAGDFAAMQAVQQQVAALNKQYADVVQEMRAAKSFARNKSRSKS